MALWISKNGRARGIDSLPVVKNGVLRSVSELYIMTASGLKLVWQALSEMWRHDDVWRDKDMW